MQEIMPWFDPAFYGGLLGAVFGCLGGLYGALVGFLAPRGKARTLVMTFHWLLTAGSALLLVAGLVAVAVRQPYGVRHALLLPGVLGAVLFRLLYPVIRRRYAEVEMRKSRVADL